MFSEYIIKEEKHEQVPMANVKAWLQSQLVCSLDDVPTELYQGMLTMVYTESDIDKVKAYVLTVNEFMTKYVLNNE